MISAPAGPSRNAQAESVELPSADYRRLTSATRLAALSASGLLDGIMDPVLDRISRLATKLLGAPIALVSLVDDRRQHFPGMAGLTGWAAEGRGTPLSHSFCQHVVARDAALLINDARVDPLVMAQPTYADFGLVAYAGVPLRNSAGETFGAMCAIDIKPVQWTEGQIAILEDLAAAAMAEIELRATLGSLQAAHEKLRQQVIRDPMTGLLNRRGFLELAKQHLLLAERTKAEFLVAAIDLDGFKAINDALGHDAGDQALVEMAALLREVCRESDVVARFGGDEFVLLLPNADLTMTTVIRARLEDALRQRNAHPDEEFSLSASLGFSAWTPATPKTMPTLLREADEAMYHNKRARRAATPAISA